MMSYKKLDMDTYKRRTHFQYFNSMAYPYVGVTVNVAITDLIAKVREKKLPFFLTVLYCVSQAANRVPELRQRIRDAGIVEFDFCKTSHTVALEDGTYCYCTLDSSMDFEDYLPYAVQAHEKAKASRRVTDDEHETEELIFISTLPWLSYVSFIQPTPMPADSNPRISWGKYFKQGEEILMPVSVLCHHALVDGLHLSQFYQSLDEEIQKTTARVAGQIEAERILRTERGPTW